MSGSRSNRESRGLSPLKKKARARKKKKNPLYSKEDGMPVGSGGRRRARDIDAYVDQAQRGKKK